MTEPDAAWDAAWEDMRAYNLRLEERAWAAEAEVKRLREKLNRAANYAESAAHIARDALTSESTESAQ